MSPRWELNKFENNDLTFLQVRSDLDETSCLFAGDPASQSTNISWKDGADLTNRIKRKDQLKGRKRPLGHRSFFDWFTDHSDPSSDEIAELIKDDIWPNPLQVKRFPRDYRRVI